MITEEFISTNDPYNRKDVRAIVECEKPDCPQAFYFLNMGSFNASTRMRMLGWEVWVIPPWNPSTSYSHAYGARCPDHAQGE